MQQSTKAVLEAALRLPESERVELVEELIEALESDGLGEDESLAADVERRSREIEAAKVEGLSWDKVKTLAREPGGGAG